MGIWAKIGWALLGLLVLAGVGVMFLLHWIMGVIFAIFTAGVLWFVFGSLKKEVDQRIAQAAAEIKLDYKPHPFRYGSLAGDYKGYAVRLSYEGSSSFGAGSVMALTTGSPGWAALDIRNLTVIRMKHGLGSLPRQILSEGPPAVIVKGDEIRFLTDGVVTDSASLRSGLEVLVSEIKGLKSGK